MEQKRTKVFPNFSYLDLNPIQFGYEACPPSHSKPRNKSANYLFHLIVEGQGEYNNETTGERLILSSGQGFLIAPGDIISYQADHQDPWTYYWLEFNGVKALSLMAEAGFSPNQSVYQPRDPGLAIPQLTSVFRQLLDEDRDVMTIALAYQLIATIQEFACLQEPIPVEDQGHQFLIKEAVKFMVRNYANPISVEDIADHCSISRTYLTRLFKEEVGTPPSKYLNQYRLSKSQELLKNPSYSIGEVAEMTGFSNQFIFSTAFKKQFGTPPTTWRKENL